MMNVKVKSLFKIVFGLSAVVIFCYLGKRFGLFDGKFEKSDMAGRKILSSEFEVFGLVQGELRNCRKVSTLSIKS